MTYRKRNAEAAICSAGWINCIGWSIYPPGDHLSYSQDYARPYQGQAFFVDFYFCIVTDAKIASIRAQ